MLFCNCETLEIRVRIHLDSLGHVILLTGVEKGLLVQLQSLICEVLIFVLTPLQSLHFIFSSLVYQHIIHEIGMIFPHITQMQ